MMLKTVENTFPRWKHVSVARPKHFRSRAHDFRVSDRTEYFRILFLSPLSCFVSFFPSFTHTRTYIPAWNKLTSVQDHSNRTKRRFMTRQLMSAIFKFHGRLRNLKFVGKTAAADVEVANHAWVEWVAKRCWIQFDGPDNWTIQCETGSFLMLILTAF